MSFFSSPRLLRFATVSLPLLLVATVWWLAGEPAVLPPGASLTSGGSDGLVSRPSSPGGRSSGASVNATDDIFRRFESWAAAQPGGDLREGIELAGWRLSATMFAELEAAEPRGDTRLADIALADIGGPGLWLRAEPDENLAQADALAAIVAMGMRG